MGATDRDLSERGRGAVQKVLRLGHALVHEAALARQKGDLSLIGRRHTLQHTNDQIRTLAGAVDAAGVPTGLPGHHRDITVRLVRPAGHARGRADRDPGVRKSVHDDATTDGGQQTPRRKPAVLLDDDGPAVLWTLRRAVDVRIRGMSGAELLTAPVLGTTHQAGVAASALGEVRARHSAGERAEHGLALRPAIGPLVLVTDKEAIVAELVHQGAGKERTERVHLDPSVRARDAAQPGVGRLIPVRVDTVVRLVPAPAVVDDRETLDQELAIGGVEDQLGQLEKPVFVVGDVIRRGVPFDRDEQIEADDGVPPANHQLLDVAEVGDDELLKRRIVTDGIVSERQARDVDPVAPISIAVLAVPGPVRLVLEKPKTRHQHVPDGEALDRELPRRVGHSLERAVDEHLGPRGSLAEVVDDAHQRAAGGTVGRQLLIEPHGRLDGLLGAPPYANGRVERLHP